MTLTTEQPSVLIHAAIVPARFALGSTMVVHGLQKLRGNGPDHAAGFLAQLGLKPAKALAIATGVSEVGSGVLSMLGLATRPAALAVLVTQGVAIAKVHAKKGFDNTKGGWEFNLALCAIALGILLRGPGKFSVHALIAQGVKARGARRPWRLLKARRQARWLDLLA